MFLKHFSGAFGFFGGETLDTLAATCWAEFRLHFRCLCEFVDFCWKLFGRISGFRICFENFLDALRIAEFWRNWRPPVVQSFGSISEVFVKLRWKLFDFRGSLSDF